MDADQSQAKKPVKVLVWKGGGPPPGYLWTVQCLSLAFDDAERRLDESQREYIAMQIQDLAKEPNPMFSTTLDIDKVETFFELRDKGGALGKSTNVRVYFDCVESPKIIRILGVDVKKNEGQTSFPVKEKIKRRKKKWDRGEYPTIEQSPPQGNETDPESK